jgi:hypothetical protein
MNLPDLSHEIVSRDSRETNSGIVSQSHSLLKGMRLRQIHPIAISALPYVGNWNPHVATMHTTRPIMQLYSAVTAQNR